MAARRPIVSETKLSTSSTLQELKAQDTIAGVVNHVDITDDTVVGKISGVVTYLDAAALRTLIDVEEGATNGTGAPGDGVVTMAKLADLAAGLVIGRASGAGTGVPSGLTGAQILAIALPMDIERTGNITATKGMLHPINVGGGASTVTPPATPAAGDIFGVMDSRGTSGTSFAITVDTSTDKLWAAANDYVIDTDGACVFFRYVNATVGWAVQSA